MISEQFKDIIRHCTQCGVCTAACPSKDVSDFNIRRLVRHVQLNLFNNEAFLSKYPWLCTQCYRCGELCTKGFEIPKFVLALRELALKSDAAPDGVYEVLKSVKRFGGPYLSLTRTKSSWIKPSLRLSAGAHVLYWVGCTSSVMAPNIAGVTAKVLTKLGLEFKLLDEEPCCGEPLIRLGLLEAAKDIAAKVVEAVERANVKSLITSCPSCYNTFTRLYPEILGIKFPAVEVFHTSQLLDQTKSANFKLEKSMVVTYHDPCSLGRHSKIYDAPRNVLKSINGVKLIEMNPAKEYSYCCGGGGGLWSLNYEMAMEIAYRKLVRDVLPLGVEGLVTCCPMCYMNFKLISRRKKVPVKVYDLAEVVAMAAGV